MCEIWERSDDYDMSLSPLGISLIYDVKPRFSGLQIQPSEGSKLHIVEIHVQKVKLLGLQRSYFKDVM